MPSVSEDNHHVRQFKNNGRHEDMRRRRAETSVELRKAKKEEQLMKRRNVDINQEPDIPSSPEAKREDIDTITIEECLEIFAQRRQSDYLKAAGSIRRTLSRVQSPPINQVLCSGIVPYLIQLLTEDVGDKTKFESAWALTNIVSGTSQQTMKVVQMGLVPGLVQLLKSDDLNVSEQATWALGNVLGDCADLRDMVIRDGAIDPLVELVSMSLPLSFLRTLTWTLSNVGRHKNPAPPDHIIQKTLPAMIQLALHQDSQVRADAAWAVSYISDGPNDRIEMVVQSGAVDLMVQLLQAGDVQFIAPALRCLGNIVTGTDAQTQAVISTGILTSIVPSLLQCDRSMVVKEATWLVSNIAAGTPAQITALVDANVIPMIIGVLQSGSFRAQVEACWTLSNLTCGGTDEQVAYMVTCGVIGPLCNLLTANEPKAVQVVLDCLSNILTTIAKKGSEHSDQICMAIEECGGLDKIEALQQHENEQIYHAALMLIEKYFSQDESEVSNGDMYLEDGTAAAPAEGFNF